jgi:hypothetical protein
MLNSSTLRLGNHLRTNEGYWQVTELVPRADNPNIIQVSVRQVSGDRRPRYGGGEVPIDEILITPESLTDFGFTHQLGGNYELTAPTGNQVVVTLHAIGWPTVDIDSIRQENLAENNIHHLQNLIQDVTGHTLVP